MSSRNRLSQATCTLCRNSAIVVAGSGERVSSCYIMYHTCSISERLESLLARAVVVHNDKHVTTPQLYVNVCYPVVEAHHLHVEEMAVAYCYQPVQCSGHCLLYTAETPNVTTSCNWWPPHHEAWGGVCVSWANAFGNMTLSRLTPYTCTSITCIQTESTLTEDNRAPFLLNRIFHDTRVDVLGGNVVYVVAWIEVHVVWVLLQADGSQWSCRCNMCPDFFLGCYSGDHCCSHNASILTCVFSTRPSRTWSTDVAKFHRPLLKAATH